MPVRIYVRFQDGKGRIASSYIHIAATTPYTPAHAYATAWANACVGVSGAEILGYDIVAHAKALYALAPGADSNAYRQGVLLFGTTEPEERYLVEIPSIKESLLETTGEYAGVKIDVTTPEIQALVTMLITGSSGVAPIGMTGNDLTTLITAYQRRL